MSTIEDIAKIAGVNVSTVSRALSGSSVHTVNPENIASFPGKRFSLLFEGEAGNKYNKRILGMRIKHPLSNEG